MSTVCFNMNICSKVFHCVACCKGFEFTVRVSYLEIYNEELTDLLGADSVENPRLKIYEDNIRKVLYCTVCLSRNRIFIIFISGWQQCIVPHGANNFQSGQFWAILIASDRASLWSSRSSWTVFSHMIEGHPGCLIQSSGRVAASILFVITVSRLCSVVEQGKVSSLAQVWAPWLWE